MAAKSKLFKRVAALIMTATSLVQCIEGVLPTVLTGRTLAMSAATVVGNLLAAQNAFAGAANDGQGFGSSMLGVSAGGLTDGDASSYVQTLGGYDQSQMTAAQNSASVGTPTLNSPGIQDFACAQQANLGLLGSNCAGVVTPATSCTDPNYNTALQDLQVNATQALAQASAVCKPVLSAIESSANLLITQAYGSGQSAQQSGQVLTDGRGLVDAASKFTGSIAEASSKVASLTNTSPNAQSYATGLPYCNGINSSDAQAFAVGVVTAANAANAFCSSLSTSVTAGTLQSVSTAISNATASFLATYKSQALQNVQAEMNGVVALMQSTNNGTLNINSLMGPYKSAGSTTLGTNTGNPLVNILNDPANAGIVGVLNKVVQSTDPMSLVPSGSGLFSVCSTTATGYATAATGGAIQSVSVPSTHASGQVSVCVDSSRAQAIPGIPGAQWVFIPKTPGDCASGMAAGTFMYTQLVPMAQTAGDTWNLFFAATSDQPATVGVSDTQGLSQSTSVAGGGAIVEGTSGSTSAPNFSVPMSSPNQVNSIAVVVTLNAPGEFALSLGQGGTTVVGTSGSWYTPPTSQTTTESTSKPGGTVSIPSPEAVQSSTSCQAAFQCLGSQCHSIMGTQDQSFSKATTGLAVLQDIAQNATCANGTSVAAGDCQLSIFQGTDSDCRDFLGSGLGLTNNCCDQPINASPIASLIKAAEIAYAAGWVPSYGSALTTSMGNWAQTAYSNTATWVNSTTGGLVATAGKVWSSVVAPFKSVAQSFSNAFGAGGPTSLSQVLGSLTHVSGTGKTATTSGGGSSGSGSGSGSTSGTSLTGSSGNVASAIGTIGSMAGLLGGGLTGVADAVIENLFPQAAATIESAMFGSASMTAAVNEPGYVMGGGAVQGDAGTSSMLGSGIVGDIMLAYAIYEIACLIGHLLTQCSNEEMKFYQDRQHRLCVNVGSYCSNSTFFGICLVTKYVACCYATMLDRIIMQQLLALDPGLVPNSTAGQPYGSPQNPACAGLTPDALASAETGGYFGQIDFSEYVAYLEQNNMIPTTNSQGAAWLPAQANHTTGLVNTNGAPTTNDAIWTGQ
jgi:hypothetical protein